MNGLKMILVVLSHLIRRHKVKGYETEHAMETFCDTCKKHLWVWEK